MAASSTTSRGRTTAGWDRRAHIQVWTNLIDNAVSAMDGEGVLTLRTALEREQLLVGPSRRLWQG